MFDGGFFFKNWGIKKLSIDGGIGNCNPYRTGLFAWIRKTHERVALAFIAAAMIFTLLVLILITVEEILPSEESAKSFHLWFQFICGDWPAFEPHEFDRRSFGFALALSFQALLAVGPIVGVVAIFWHMGTAERRALMTLMDALRLRDRMIKTQVLGKFAPDKERAVPLTRSDIEQKFNEAHDAAARRWAQEQLPNLVGYERARFILERLEKEQIF